MNPRTDLLPFLMACSITIILVVGSWMRLDEDIKITKGIHTWLKEKPSSNHQNHFPVEIPVCSKSGRMITFWKSKAFKIFFYENGKWSAAHQGAYSLNGNGIDFMWHRNENFKEEDLPLPDKGRYWKSPSKDYFVHYFGNYYSNLYCRDFNPINHR